MPYYSADEKEKGFRYKGMLDALLDTDNRARMAMYGPGEGVAQNLLANARAGNALTAPSMPGERPPMGGASPSEMAQTAMYMTPIVGSALSLRDAYNSAEQGNYGDSALSALGAIPEVGGIIAGAASKTANLKKLAQAAQMHEAGADRTDIWNQTGWFTGHDGQWRYEIPDDKLALRGISKDGTSFSSFTHPDLKRAYPIGEQILGGIYPSGGAGSYSQPLSAEAVAAIKEAGQDVDPLRVSGFITASGRDEGAATSTLAHELQHAVQYREGFATGGNIDPRGSFTPDDVSAEKERRFQNFLNDPKVQDHSYPGWWKDSALTAEDHYTDDEIRMDMYRRLAGEIEARNVQYRMDLTPELRQGLPPWETEDYVAQSYQHKGPPIVRMPGGGTSKEGASIAIDPQSPTETASGGLSDASLPLAAAGGLALSAAAPDQAKAEGANYVGQDANENGPFPYKSLSDALIDTDNRARIAKYGTGEGGAKNLLANAEAGNALTAPFMPGQPAPLGNASPSEMAKTGLYMTPIVGSAMSAGDAIASAQKGDYGSSALSAAGMIPEVGGIIAGAMSKTANLKKLAEAAKMREGGADPGDIWNKTGWYYGADGLPRYEIPDNKLSLKGISAPADLNTDAANPTNFLFNSFTHPELRKAYPIKEPVIGSYGPDAFSGGQYSRPLDPENVKALRDAGYFIDPSAVTGFIKAGGANSGQATDNLLHELQHVVQAHEGFSMGGHPMEFTPEEVKAEQDRLFQQMKDSGAKIDPSMTSENQFPGFQTRMDMYRRLAGEVEARNVQNRWLWPQEAREASPPWLSDDSYKLRGPQLLKMPEEDGIRTAPDMPIRNDLSANPLYSVGLLGAAGLGLDAATQPAQAQPPQGANPVNYTPYDRDIAIRTVIGEAGDQGPAGMAAVANVIKNRAQAGFGDGLADVALAKGQFEPWGNKDTANRLSNIDPNSPEYKQAASVVDGVLSGQSGDNTNGATHFFAPKLQSDLGRNVPSWAKSFPETAEIGDHSFYQDPQYSGKLGTPQPFQLADNSKPIQDRLNPDGTTSLPVQATQPVPVAPQPAAPQPQPAQVASNGNGTMDPTQAPQQGGILGGLLGQTGLFDPATMNSINGTLSSMSPTAGQGQNGQGQNNPAANAANILRSLTPTDSGNPFALAPTPKPIDMSQIYAMLQNRPMLGSV